MGESILIEGLKNIGKILGIKPFRLSKRDMKGPLERKISWRFPMAKPDVSLELRDSMIF